ncbi:MAG: small multi-drug export protein [Chloroflexi bacterium]|nr:small multi-drug export protein [Chloroflexota bacterium]
MSPAEILSLGLPKELAVIILAALPVTELRGALPVALNLFQLPWFYALTLAVIGNLIPVPLLLLSLNAIAKLMSKVAILDRMFRWFLEHSRRRGKTIERYKLVGLALFVALPLPGTGVWTGSAAAVLFGLKFSHALISILIGTVIAGVIVTSLSLLVGFWLWR